jgi:hypothetical protein
MIFRAHYVVLLLKSIRQPFSVVKRFVVAGDAKPQDLIADLTSWRWEIRASDGSLLELGSYSNNVNKFCCITTVNRQSWLGRPRKRGSLPDSRFALAEPN